MRVSPESLAAALKKGLASSYLVSGDEPLQVEETCDAIRAAARAAGFTDRKVFAVERGFSWDELYAESRAMSLFSDRRVIEIRMPTGKADKKGLELLLDLAKAPSPDILLLVITGKLDQKTAAVPWAAAIAATGVTVAIWPIDATAAPAWLTARAKIAGFTLDRDAAELIAERAEGNLLAAAQELEKLQLLSSGPTIGLELVRESVANSAKYDVFQMAEAAAAGNAPRAIQVLQGLKAEGTEPTLLLWAVVREIRGLWQVQEARRLRTNGYGSGWNLASKPSPEALARGAKLPLQTLLAAAADADLIVKGQAKGDPWSAISALTLALAGALPASMASVRS